MVTAVMDSHRRVALWVTTGTWTRVQLTYGNNRNLLRVSAFFNCTSWFCFFVSLSCFTVNTDTETAVVNVTYATKEETKV